MLVGELAWVPFLFKNLSEVEVGTNNILTNYHETDFEKLIEDIVEIKNLEINKWNSKSKDKELER